MRVNYFPRYLWPGPPPRVMRTGSFISGRTGQDEIRMDVDSGIIRVTLSCPRILQLLRLRHCLVYFFHFSEQDRVSFKYRPLFPHQKPECERRRCFQPTLARDPAWQRPVLMRDAAGPCSSSAAAASSEAARLAPNMLVLRE
ncbi:hypothetical protein Q8A67_022140 [Cirrhinus molitorella]|uniref:Uncharacterized protein n=1 Tax=Cirrhinus molitorella TaxID=172907 RepID=A0AA88PF55_9TELE|nr:hypothetical protein Q8A67_022140 [Cirrhinus molitorella]